MRGQDSRQSTDLGCRAVRAGLVQTGCQGFGLDLVSEVVDRQTLLSGRPGRYVGGNDFFQAGYGANGGTYFFERHDLAAVDRQDGFDSQNCPQEGRCRPYTATPPQLFQAWNVEVHLGAFHALFREAADFGRSAPVRCGNDRALDAHSLCHADSAGVHDFDRYRDTFSGQLGGVHRPREFGRNVNGDHSLKTAPLGCQVRLLELAR
jgi:hypothetical protein